MTLITNTWRQLIRRRLWPIALLLVAALVAVPLKLAKKPEPVAAVPAATLAKAEQAEADAKPIVQLKTPSDETAVKKRRRVLGQAKDPFAPAPLPKKKKAKAAATATPAPTETTTPADSGGGTSAPPSSAPTTPAEPTVSFSKGALKIRFGDTNAESDELPTLYVNRLEPVPNTTTPVLVFEGTRDNGKTALFSIPGEVTAVGDGKCAPTPQNCEDLRLRAGQTEFITVKGAGPSGADLEFELDLVKIFDKVTKVPKSEVDATATGAGS
jgi:hypothetical protein